MLRPTQRIAAACLCCMSALICCASHSLSLAPAGNMTIACLHNREVIVDHYFGPQFPGGHRSRGHLSNMCICSLSTVPLHACRALAVLLGLYSLAVIVAEATITPALPNMSIFSQTLRRVAHNTIACEMLCFLFLIYPCCAAYFAIYKLGRWSFYLLVPRCTAAAGGSGLVLVALVTIV